MRPYVGAIVQWTSGIDKGPGCDDSEIPFEVYAAIVVQVYPDDSVQLRIMMPGVNDFELDTHFSSARAGSRAAQGYWNWAVPQNHPRHCMTPKRPPSGDWMLGLPGDENGL